MESSEVEETPVVANTNDLATHTESKTKKTNRVNRKPNVKLK